MPRWGWLDDTRYDDVMIKEGAPSLVIKEGVMIKEGAHVMIKEVAHVMIKEGAHVMIKEGV